jgi:hypothetical protein
VIQAADAYDNLLLYKSGLFQQAAAATGLVVFPLLTLILPLVMLLVVLLQMVLLVVPGSVAGPSTHIPHPAWFHGSTKS